MHEAEGLMFYGEELIVPARLLEEMLILVHGSHQGIEKTEAREVMYWPGTVRDIVGTVIRCSKCAEWPRSNQKEPLIFIKFLLVRGKTGRRFV